jgi:hypothetical protein
MLPDCTRPRRSAARGFPQAHALVLRTLPWRIEYHGVGALEFIGAERTTEEIAPFGFDRLEAGRCGSTLESTERRFIDIGGYNPGRNGRWKEPVSNVVQYIERGEHRFYTHEGNAWAWVRVRTGPSGRKFIRTYADGIWKDNLLALPRCA